jgi:DNA helicase-2/ATP-dependent DNA helicase PcrA
MDLLARLNPAQRDAVSAPPGPLLVVAGPGSGKTRVLTHRIAYLIREMRVSPWHIMAVTFTNKAAREMEHRIEQLLDGRPQGLNMGTFHAICARLLRREVDNLTHYQRDFVIFDTADQLQVVKQALAELTSTTKNSPRPRCSTASAAPRTTSSPPTPTMATNYIGEVTRRVYERLPIDIASQQRHGLRRPADERRAALRRKARRPGQVSGALRATSWSTSSRTPTPRSTACCASWPATATASSPWAIPTSRSTSGAARTIATSRTSTATTPNRGRSCWSKTTAQLRSFSTRPSSVIRRNADHIPKKLFTERPGGAQIVLREAYNEIGRGSDQSSTPSKA